MDRLYYILNYILELEERIYSFFEKKIHIDFSERYIQGAIEYNDKIIHYETIRRRQFKKIERMFRRIDKEKEFVNVIDYGCGKGYLLWMMYRMKYFENILGVEILPELYVVALNNIRRLKCMKVKILCVDARYYENIDNYNCIFMFNPFPIEAMQQVVERLKESILRRKRRICIIYINNVYGDYLEKSIIGINKIKDIENLPKYGCKTAIYVIENDK